MNITITETKHDLHLKVQEVKYFNPFTRQGGQYTLYCFCLFEKAVGILH